MAHMGHGGALVVYISRHVRRHHGAMVVPSDMAACPEGAHAQLDALDVLVFVLAHQRRGSEKVVRLCVREGREGSR